MELRRGLAALAVGLIACTAGQKSTSTPDGGTASTGPHTTVDGGGVPDGGAPDSGTDGGVTLPPDAGVPPDLGHTIKDENEKPGTSDWRITTSPGGMGAFTNAASYLPGDTVEVHAASPDPGEARWQLFRLGYYQGLGGRLILDGSATLPAASGPVLDPDTGAVSAPWGTAFSFQLPSDLVSGVYVVKLTQGPKQAYALFVVREATPKAPILVSIAINTYQAYNTWGGTSLYDNFRKDWSRSCQPVSSSCWHAFAVSFDRPFARGFGAGNLFLNGDRDFITFAEGEGYELAYVTDVDLDREPSLTQHRAMIAIPGHTEYWTRPLREAIEGAIGSGVNVAFLGANDAYWQVRFSGQDRRLLLGYKEFAQLDPMWQTDPSLVTGKWRDSPLGMPESEMIGVMFGDWVFTSTQLHVLDPGSWLWAGTGLAAGDTLPGVFGDETDHAFDGDEPEDVSFPAQGMVEDHFGDLSHGQTSIHTAPSGAQVFSAGTLEWCRALAREGFWDPRVQQATANVIWRFGYGQAGAAPLKALQLPPGAPTPDWVPGVSVKTIASGLSAPVAIAFTPGGDAVVVDQSRIVRVSADGAVSPIAGGDPGYRDGPASSARFDFPRGIAVGSDGTIYVADTGNERIRAIAHGQVTTLAGNGHQAFADGSGSAAAFSVPEGLALDGSGNLLVADTWNNRVRKVTPQGQVTTFAGSGALGATNGPSAQASFDYPFSLAVGGDGTVYVVEAETAMVRTISPAGQVGTLAGSLAVMGWTDGPVDRATVSESIGVAAGAGHLVLLDGATGRVREVSQGRIDTLAGGGSGKGDGAGDEVRFGYPRGAAFAKDGSLWVVDARLGTVRRITLPQ